MAKYVRELMDYDVSVLQRLIVTGNNGGESLFAPNARMQARKVIKYNVAGCGAEIAIQQLKEVGDYLSRHFGNEVSEQGNTTDDKGRRLVYTAFPSGILTPSDLEKEAKRYAAEKFGNESEIDVIRHVDAIDILPKPKNGISLDKGTSIREVAKELDSVFTLDAFTVVGPNLQIPEDFLESIRAEGFAWRPNAKVNMGLGRAWG